MILIKKVLKSLGILLYLALLLVFGVTYIKPGAAIYYAKFYIPVEEVNQTEEIIDYSLTLNRAFLDVDTLLVREGDQILARVKTEELPSSEPGVFAVEGIDDDSVVVRIIPASETQLTDYEDNFCVLVRPYFVTSLWITLIFVSLALGLVMLIITLFIDPQVRKVAFSSIFGIFKLWDQTDEQKFSFKTRLTALQHAAVDVVLVSFIYVLMEWIFYVTKSSFMDVLSFGEKLGVMLNTGLAVCLVALLIVFITFLLDCLFSILITPYHRLVYSVPAGLLWACLGLILVDNFTYTVFGFGVVTSNTLGRIIYAVGFLGLFVYAIYELNKKHTKQFNRKREQKRLFGNLILIAIMLVSSVLSYNPLQGVLEETDSEISTSNLPNIILISNDGLNAESMSVYGYERETTPFLEELAETALVMENNFTNANKSTGSDTALLTGKSPFDTGVLFPPNTLQDIDMYEHLPGILKRYGYKTISYGVQHFVDVSTVNFQNAFDSINGEENKYSEISDTASQYGYSDAVYFITTIVGRITDRVQHIFFIKVMENTYVTVTEGSESSTLSETTVFTRLISNLEEAQSSNQPLFAHIHLISTHGPTFSLTSQTFSAGQEQTENWMVDFYDDAILNYDQTIEELVQYLQENGLYDNTILVFYSDHGKGWTVENKIPLIIRFPDGQYAGSVTASTQNMDIAPTLLDYLGIEVPSWMSGESLLGEIDQTRLIFAAEMKDSIMKNGSIVSELIEAPFYQFGYIDVIQCQRFYKIDLQELTMEVYDIENHTDPCSESMLYSEEEIWEKTGEFLTSLGYDLPEDW